MLYVETVEPQTLRLLDRLMASSALKNFCLVGGTGLSLRYGHRKSIDLDLFSTVQFDNDELLSKLRLEGFEFKETFSSNKLGVFGFIEEIKVDLVRHHYVPLIDEIKVDQGIRIFGDKDIISMKISAILRRAVKKDFWDIAELLNHYTLDEVIRFYETKYPNEQVLISIPRALTYFDEAENSPNPDCLLGLSWEDVKSKIRKAVREYLS
jgi:predicted nucleotidyltransferase component of viral defense system